MEISRFRIQLNTLSGDWGSKEGWDVILPEETDQNKVMQGIALAKSHQLDTSKDIFLRQIDLLKRKGADAIVLGCTELPAVLDETLDLIDSNKALARRCIRWFDATYHGKVDLTAYKKIKSVIRPVGL